MSPGCKHCYAERMAKRLRAMGQPRYANGFRVTLQEDLVEQPLHWKAPRRIFVNSMSDLFHLDVPAPFIRRIFRTMEEADWHELQILTKPPERLRDLAERLPWPDNVEPLLGPLPAVPLDGIHWIIVGGESGPRARPMDPEWVRQIRARCLDHGVPFFFKLWGGTRKARTGREERLRGRAVLPGARPAGRLFNIWQSPGTATPSPESPHG